MSHKQEEENMHSLSTVIAVPGVRVSKVMQLAGAFLLGTVILYGAAFAQTPAVHNAAHDMRHSQGFPCH